MSHRYVRGVLQNDWNDTSTNPAHLIDRILGDPGADKGGEGKSKRPEKYGMKESKERREELFSPFFTFLRVIFFRPFRLSLVPTICPWVSEDGSIGAKMQNLS